MKKNKSEFIKYFEQINKSVNETQKKERFISFLERVFSENTNIKSLIDKITGGAENYLKIIKDNKDYGFADTQYENIIIEFENNLKKTEEHAKSQLLEYLSAIYKSEKKINYRLISTDGIKWIIYYFDSTLVKKDINWDNLDLLKEKEVFVVNKLNFEDFYFFLSKYLFQNVEKNPTLNNFIDDFGIKSNLFANCFFELNDVYSKIKNNPSVIICFEEWKKYLSIAYNFRINSEETFITHTYISIFTKILTYKILSKDDFIDSKELQKILDGTIFYSLNVQNFTEKDFFSWASTSENINKIFKFSQLIVNEINNYNFSSINEDILKGIYQEFMDIDSKKALGEYYTPDWLCELIVENINIKENSKIIDPSCGSGSFLRASINKLIKKNLTIEEISSRVYGLDIHPLSVLISKTTILLTLKNKIKELKKPLLLNVFMTNTLLPPFEETLEGSTFNLRINTVKYNLNSVIFENLDIFNDCLNFCNDLAKLHQNKNTFNYEQFEKSFKGSLKGKNYNELITESFHKIYKGLKNAKDQDRNTIWKFILSNLYRPYFFKNQFDIVIGNPPWFTYKSINSKDYKEDLKKIGKTYDYLPEGQQNLTHYEVAALFIAHCFKNYFKKKSKLAFVLPRSFFNGMQHEKTRNEHLEKMKITEIWDLEEVKPLFKTVSCVLFFDNFSPKNDTKAWDGKILSGKLPSPDMNLISAQKYLDTKKSKFYLSNLGDQTAITKLKTSTHKINYYKDKFYQGATITPRNLYFFDFNQKNPGQLKDKKINIKTSEEINKTAKKPYKDKKIEGLISSKYINITCLSNSLIPFGFTRFYKIVLPLIKKPNNLEIFSSQDMEMDGDLDSSRWFNKAEVIWKKNNKSMTLYERLNYQNLLTKQSLEHKFVVLYTSSAKDVSAAVFKRNEQELDFIVESKAYCYFTNNLKEAYFLVGFLNSNYANKMIKDFQTTGDFGHRDIHKRILQVPLTEFKENIKSHINIADISKECESIIKQFINKQKFDDLSPVKLGKIRLEAREKISDNLKKIDTILTKL